MSKIRTVKPEFWSSEQVMSCSSLARLLFIGLWNFCDDNGVHPASYLSLKARVLPGDNFTNEEVAQWISELIDAGLLLEYSVDKHDYWIVTGWKKHQRIDKPTYRHPLPDYANSYRAIDNKSQTTSIGLADGSANDLRISNDSSITESNGRESNGKETNIREVKTSLRVVSDSDLLANTEKVFEYWQTVMSHPKAKLDSKRRSKIQQAFNLGYSVDELLLAIDGCAKTPFNMGANDRRQQYNDIELIFRDASHIERFIQNTQTPPSQNNNMDGTSNDNVFEGVI